jgi:hypothetical protein
LTLLTALYLISLPFSYRQFEIKLQEPAVGAEADLLGGGEGARETPAASETKH